MTGSSWDLLTIKHPSRRNPKTLHACDNNRYVNKTHTFCKREASYMKPPKKIAIRLKTVREFNHTTNALPANIPGQRKQNRCEGEVPSSTPPKITCESADDRWRTRHQKLVATGSLPIRSSHCCQALTPDRTPADVMTELQNQVAKLSVALHVNRERGE